MREDTGDAHPVSAMELFESREEHRNNLPPGLARVLSMREAGMSRRQIMGVEDLQALAMVDSRVERLRAMGYLAVAKKPRPERPGQLPLNRDDAAILRLRAQGMFGRDIARELGMSESRLSIRVKAMGPAWTDITRPSTRRMQARQDQALAMIRQGAGRNEVAAAIGVTPDRLDMFITDMRKRGHAIPMSWRGTPSSAKWLARQEMMLECLERALPMMELGMTCRAIAEVLGMAPKAYSHMMGTLRARGHAVPYGNKRKLKLAGWKRAADQAVQAAP